MSKKRSVYKALPIVAATYGEKFGVKVLVGKDDAYTDGESITIPNIPENYANMDAVWGYLAHEAAHIRFTDFESVSQWGQGTKRALANIIEDYRIEVAMMAVYPGTTQTLKETVKYAVQANLHSLLDDQCSPAQILTGFCLYWLRTKAFKQTVLDSHLISAENAMKNVFPQGVFVKLSVLIRRALEVKSTQGSLALAEDILTMIEDERDSEENNPQPKPEDDQSGQNADQQQDQSNSDETESKTDSQNQNNSESVSDFETKTGLNSGLDSNQLASVNADVLQQVLDATDDEFPQDVQAALKEELIDLAEESGDNHKPIDFQVAEDTVNDFHRGDKLLEHVRSNTSRLRTQLYGLVQAKQRSAQRTHRSGKRVDVNKLHRLVSGDTRVFSRPEDKVQPNTAVHILVDLSGSMDVKCNNGKTRTVVAQESALALCLALESIQGVNPAVSYFAGLRKKSVFSVIKHGQKPHGKAGKFAFDANGNTPLREGIWHAAFELSKTREQRKMIVVITDGEPNRPSSVTPVINLCEDSGIDMIGVGIGTYSVSAYFKQHIVINDAVELQNTLFELMGDALVISAA